MNFHSPAPTGPQELNPQAMAKKMKEIVDYLKVYIKEAQDKQEH
jgi:hypothetical protein